MLLSQTSSASVFEVIVRVATEVLPQLQGRAVQPTDRLEDLGANSLDRADIVVMALQELGLAIPLTEVFGPRNVGELAELLHAKRQLA
jgi:polyketide biosynthesis acyl carrier protein